MFFCHNEEFKLFVDLGGLGKKDGSGVFEEGLILQCTL